MAFSFKDQTFIITGAGGGIGHAYSLFFASRGANVVVNDLSKEAAQKVVDEITKSGGKAVADTHSVLEGEGIVKTALDTFGKVHVLINNAGILRDKSFKNMSDAEWDLVIAVHMFGAFSCSKAVWPHFRAQKFGRIINTASAAGLYGNLGQANYSAAKMGLVAFTKTLAIEGAKYNIRASCIAPMAASAMTETIMPPEMLQHLNPSFIAPLIAVLTHPDGPNASGKVFEAGAGWMGEIRWERSKGAVFKTDDTFTPSAVKERWHEVTSFDTAEYPMTMADTDMMGVLKQSKTLPPNKQSELPVRFDGKACIVTGAGGGIGRAYSHMFGKLGGQVVVNDVNAQAAQKVVDEIKTAGGKAIAVACSVEEGDKIAKAAMDAFGRIDVLIANAGILRDKSFTAMSQREWDDVIKVHLKGTYACAKAVWPIFQKQRYGRIITTASQVGIYGNFGQANYSAAKAAILGLTRTLAIEGSRYGILCNTLAPSAGTAMTSTIWPAEMVEMFKPDFVAPVVGYLVSEANTETTGCLFEVFGGCATQTRWQRAGGHGFPSNRTLKPEDVLSKWNVITNFDDGRATHPTSTQEAIQQIVDNFHNTGDSSSPSAADDDDPEVVREAKNNATEPCEYTYTDRDVILYNLGVGATAEELKWTFEGDDEFQALLTFGVIPGFASSSGMSLDFLPNFNPAKLLHGEQYLSIKAPIPTSGTLISTTRLLEALDKSKQAAVTTVTETKDASTGKVIFETQSTAIIRGSGGFGGQKRGKDRGAATASNTPPKRQPDAVVEERTSPNQAALYRLSGDYNPLHIQPEFAAIGGFDRPILHGLCFFGISGKHVLKTFGAFKDIKVRFSGSVYPGETLITEMWKEGDKVIFQTKVKERGATVMSAAGATLVGTDELKAKL
ncbi:peroxisomal hydratase-dehydrogenase-epimerase [Dacryopinax primogenitus]|uniref:Peroxisomal hydratase-dehydrogenase-epimerase n=1 Tax=Dacryopinax primogenitus (strain DJM 731) TaxID=1858805 RepID=M5G7G3_DACPD|nr:peroxisomal hydratase-dehydrogenase-epimerase [Dacryopinax primogenitus]EJU04669.1 peroxisomal hydratase-dehydrogenase-epimerase [Dacryopinax primogenitus]